MAPPWISTLASVGMAIGPPLVYVDQTTSIIRKKYVPLTCSTEFRSSPLFRDSTGFSRDVCAVLCASHTLFLCLVTDLWIRLLANITRCFFWLGEHFEFALLVQSLLMIVCQVSPSHMPLKKADLSQLALLYICVLYRPRLSPENLGASSRPLGFWQWTTYSQHVEFLAGYMYGIQRIIIIFIFSLTLVSSLRFWCLYSAIRTFSYGSLASLPWD
jgi:solute carrier family 66, member 2